MDKMPLADDYAGMVICQEGIEHFSDQLKALKEFNRILKQGGRLIITTPSYSHLTARLRCMLFGSEASKLMPPNEPDNIWMADKSIRNRFPHRKAGKVF
jgi:ubiquinone/menaquinone biosynthesis C-methylase UbiE